jgi:hypothetical protein
MAVYFYQPKTTGYDPSSYVWGPNFQHMMEAAFTRMAERIDADIARVTYADAERFYQEQERQKLLYNNYNHLTYPYRAEGV